jgi:ATP-binding cassette, subfamily B, bacterial
MIPPDRNRKRIKSTPMSWHQTVAIFARYWFAEPRKMVWIGIFLLAGIICESITPVALGALVGQIAQSISSKTAVAGIWTTFAIVATAMLAQFGFKQILDRHWNPLSIRSMQRLQLDLVSRVQRFSSDWHANSFAGATVHRISRARWALDMLSNVVILRMVPPALLVLILGSIMCYRFWEAGIAFFVMAAIYIYVSVQLSAKWVRPASLLSAAKDSQLTGALADSIGNNAAVKSFASEDREDQLLKAISDEWAKLCEVNFNRQTDTGAIQSLIWAAAQLIVIAVVLYFALEGRASVADAAFAISANLQLSVQIRTIGQDIRTVQRAYAEFEDAAEFLVVPMEIADGDTPVDLSRKGKIVFKDVSFAYPSGHALYENLSLTIAPGERVALVGPSGSGKSTFVKLVQRLYDVDHGSILIDGVDIAAMPQMALRSIIASVPQEPVLFHRSLADNIGYARPEASRDEIIAAARRARADEFIEKLSNGYDTMVGERGVKLSGGERQRVAIARAFLADRPILLLDEATSSLDMETERLVQDAIEELAHGRTTIIIAHRLSTVRQASRILVFDQGTIVEQGSHEELMAQANGRYRHLHDLQSRFELAEAA